MDASSPFVSALLTHLVSWPVPKDAIAAAGWYNHAVGGAIMKVANARGYNLGVNEKQADVLGKVQSTNAWGARPTGPAGRAIVGASEDAHFGCLVLTGVL